MKKERLDVLMVQRNLAESREKAKAVIMAGIVYVDDQKEDKAGSMFEETAKIEVRGSTLKYVSRGGLKLEKAMTHFGVTLDQKICMDVGASTGGFTDCMLQNGAQKVYAVDVGKEQLHERMRRDPRVISMEGTNLRTAPEELIPEPVDIIVADVSFISLTLILPPCVRWLKEGGLVAALVKPQFELGPHQTDKGVVRDPALRQQAVDKVLLFCQERLGLECLGVVPAAVKGPKGNQEYIVCLRRVGAGQVACGSEVEQ